MCKSLSKLLTATALAVTVCACGADATSPAFEAGTQTDSDSMDIIPGSQSADYLNPVENLGELFTDVQLGEVFPDSKTFVDMVPKSTPEEILADYRDAKQASDFDLAAFVAKNFEAPKSYAKDFTTDFGFNLDKHIERLWPVLTRDEERQAGGSLIPLPYDYVVPGGRFREVYYWDSYFTMLGLLVDGQDEYATHMVDNFAFLIDQVGFIPNGNRSYYLSRSQPPFFGPMVGLLVERGGEEVLLKYLPQLQKEYDFWMRGTERLSQAGDKTLRVARTTGNFTLNRYYDELPRPRPEGYAEDSLLTQEFTQREPKALYRDIRAACESGWDFSSRWLSDPMNLGTIRTTEIAPVDLNSLLYYLEDMLMQGYGARGDDAKQQQYAQLAYERRRAVLTLMYDQQQEWFVDYDLETKTGTPELTLAGLFPLYFELATPEQAATVAKHLEAEFLKEGGLLTSLKETGQQWDAPNGWPPLQWIAVKGLRNYGHEKLAKEIARRWLGSGRKVYRQTGKIVEKYNVVDTSTIAGGGEYPNQDGFGWSNGVFARLIEDYPGL